MTGILDAHMLRRALPLLLALLAAACGSDRTGILVEVTSSDLAVPDDVDTLRFQARSAYGGTIDETFAIAGAWPHSLTIVPPEGERTGPITITVTGLRGGAFVVRRVVQTEFMHGTTRRVSVDLPGSCRAIECPEGVDCRGGSCVGIESDAGVDGGLDAGPPPDDDAGIDAQVPTDDAGLDASTPSDAGIDGGTDGGRDGGAIDSGIDGGAPLDAGSVFRCDSAACAGRVLISEVAPRSSTSASDEFVELHNPGPDPIDVGGVELRYVSASGASETGRGSLPAGTIIAPHGYLLLTSAGYAGPVASDMLVTPWTTGLADSGSVYIRTAGSNVIDTFGWGGAMRVEGTSFPTAATASAPSFERKANASSSAATMSAGGSDATAGNAYDTDHNDADFVARSTRDPQSRASAPEP